MYIDVPENSARILIKLPVYNNKGSMTDAMCYMAKQTELFIKQIFVNINSKPVDIRKVYCHLYKDSYEKLSRLLALALSCSTNGSRAFMLLDSCAHPKFDKNTHYYKQA